MPRTPAPAAATGLPAPFDHQPQLRALLMLPSIPAGCLTIQVPDDRFHPHLREGEFAIIDMADRKPERGEIYLISYSSQRFECRLAFKLCRLEMQWSRLGSDRVLRSMKDTDMGEPVEEWWAFHHRRPHDALDQQHMLRMSMLGTKEGPFLADHLGEKLVGRVIGVFVPKVGDEREASAC